MNAKSNRIILSTAACTLAISALASADARAETSGAKAVLGTYADIALAGYEDSLASARLLDGAIDALIAAPGPETHRAAKAAWLSAREPYQQTEAYRFGNAIVDDWEGKVNAWPLDEGLIDYVEGTYGDASDENPFYTVNLIANANLSVGGEMVDASAITPDLLANLHELGDVEANVSTGYHAIEFLLWGQDLNGTAAGAGARPHTDFDAANCTGGNCERRAQYLKAASTLLMSDLEEMVANWTADGAARAALMNGSSDRGLAVMITGMGSMSYGELAGERMKLGLLLNDPEEEHDCFSDNTHNSHLYDAIGIQNVYLGRYRRIDGTVVEGPSLSDLVAEKDAAADAQLRDRLEATVQAMLAMRRRAETVEAYDQMLGAGNDAGNATVQAAIDALLNQTQAIEAALAALDLSAVEFEGSDSLDSPDSVFE